MPLGGRQIIMVQHFPATDDYIVHYQGNSVEFYSGEDSIDNDRVNRFITSCLEEHLYHEGTVHLATGKVSGAKTLPVKQVIYCKAFACSEAPEGSQNKATNINWVLWVPTSYELTVNRGILGMAKTVRLRDLADAPQEVRDFMEGCTDGQHVALSHHYSEPDRSGGVVRMKNISEYFFSTGKVIYGFQHDRVQPVTKAEMDGLGLEFQQ